MVGAGDEYDFDLTAELCDFALVMQRRGTGISPFQIPAAEADGTSYIPENSPSFDVFANAHIG